VSTVAIDRGCPYNEDMNATNQTASIAAKWARLADAITYALDIHSAQVRKGANTPYIGHLLGVASLVLESGGDEEQAIAGVLHDAIEDQGVEQEGVILARFGGRVAAIVRGCTDADTNPKPPWRARKQAYMAHLETAGPDIWLVSCADKLYNARAILTDLQTHGPVVFERFTAGQDGTLWYYATLASAFSRLLPGTLSRELNETVQRMKANVSNIG
jgi:(p)ppGpp synthase/HD superfamily hydrolase